MHKPDLLASKEDSIPDLPVSSEEELVDEDDKKEEESGNESCKPGSKASGDDSDSESDGENAQGINPGQISSSRIVMWIRKMIKMRTERMMEKEKKTPMKTRKIKTVFW